MNYFFDNYNINNRDFPAAVTFHFVSNYIYISVRFLGLKYVKREKKLSLENISGHGYYCILIGWWLFIIYR